MKTWINKCTICEKDLVFYRRCNGRHSHDIHSEDGTGFKHGYCVYWFCYDCWDTMINRLKENNGLCQDKFPKGVKI